ncbi:MAG: flagellar hook protein FlgE [Bdellovibrionales bacterium]|nr:flagellar hook protein FlgE [Bdellovibrionales bacterium]
MSIINGLFAGRAGIGSHGSAIAVIGDNISNASTIGYKASRAEFEDLIAGGQATGKTIGSGSQLSSVTTDFSQGTLEFTSKPLDLAIDGNGFFVVANGESRFYTRAGNFSVNSAGIIVDQNGYAVLGFPENGTGALEMLNINSVTSTTTETSTVTMQGNLDAGAPAVDLDTLFGATRLTGGTLDTAVAGANGTAATTTYSDLAAPAAFQTVVDVIDSLGEAHTVTVFFYKDDSAANTWEIRSYVSSEQVDAAATLETGEPRLIGRTSITFPSSGSRPQPGTSDIAVTDIPWNNGSDQTQDIDVTFFPFTQFAANSNISAITQNGQGVGAVTSVNIEADGTIFALLDNGESTTIGVLGLVNFANPEGLKRVGSNLLARTNRSGEPVQGTPGSGTLGNVLSGSIELSTTDTAAEFVKLITLQRGFQANARIITSIDQLLNEIIQLA